MAKYLFVLRIMFTFAVSITYNIFYIGVMDIKKRIREHGFTLEELARRLKSNRSGEEGISQPALSSIVNGNTTVARLQEIASVLGISLSELVREDDEQPSAGSLCPHCGKPIRIEKG